MQRKSPLAHTRIYLSPRGLCCDQIHVIVKPSTVHFCSTLLRCPTGSDFCSSFSQCLPTTRSQRHGVRNTVWVCILNDRKAVPVPSARVHWRNFKASPSVSYGSKGVSYSTVIYIPNPYLQLCVHVCNTEKGNALWLRTTGEKFGLHRKHREGLQWNGANRAATRWQNVLLPAINQTTLLQTHW